MYHKTDYRKKFTIEVNKYEKITNSKHIRLIYSLEQQVLNKFFQKIDSKNKSLMDFACGSGRWTQYLENEFSETVGVDVSDQMLAYAKGKCKKAQFISTDITNNPVSQKLSGKKFDVITAFRFYKNAESKLREQVTAEIGKYLKNGGYFIFDLHLNTFSIMGIIANIMNFFKLNKLFKLGNLKTRTIALHNIKKLFKGSEFKIVDYFGTGIFPGRSNYTILPFKLLNRIESYFTHNKILRNYCYTILVIAQKIEKNN